ncbi:hypothetical protein DPM18_04675 [Polynucleobacter paneuropaeus]|uniref:hypothetical protein n=1 Tax=Polynucleobacter paneuropaeus TaxID=2527775 RepID=UPI000DBEF451|nr:hypothetical protein [Polynucleobacter paneuropaeus]AWW46162.1 hypothetical protein DPM18_04675 [Polynucleobacter paneuropaeus]
MKRIFLLLSTILLVVACSSDNKIIGKWKHVTNKDGLTSVEVCNFIENNTETCNEDFKIQIQNDLIETKYIITQGWTLKGEKIIEKNIDAKIQSVSINGASLLSTDGRYERVANIILSLHPRGESFSRRIKFSGDTFTLISDDGKANEFNRLK